MASDKIPGVYSSIDASAALKSLSANDYVIGIIATGTTDDTTLLLTNKAYAPLSFDDAKIKYGIDSNIVKIMNTAIDNGGSKFIIVRVDNVTAPSTPDYVAALAVSELEEAIDIVLTDSMSPTVFTSIKTSNNSASTNRKERTAVVGFDTNTDIATVIASAITMNSGRMLTAYPNMLDSVGAELPGFYAAAAIAGQLAKEQDPSMPLTGVELAGFYGVSKKLKDSEMEALIDAGVIPLEARNGTIRIVRCITTYTKDAQDSVDITWQEVTTIRISDYIFKDLRATLSREFQRAKQNKDTRDAISSKVMTKLLTYEELDYLENVEEGDVTIEINPFNPLRNDVKFKYDVTGPLNVINLTGYLII
jgi:phage tail sheath gpL-like